MLQDEEIEWLVASAFVFIQYNKPLKAIALLEWVLEERPQIFDAAKNLVMAYYQADQLDQSEKLCDQLLRALDPEDPDHHYLNVLKSLIASRKQQMSVARKLFFKFIDFRGIE